MVVMRRHTRPENARAARRKLYGAAKAEIGSRVFPLPAPPAPMPSVGTRRSTRVFVPKTAAARAGDGDSRALRSGKRLAVRKHGDECLGVFGGGGTADIRWWIGEDEGRRDLECSAGLNEPDGLVAGAAGNAGESPESIVPNETLDRSQGKRFGIVYRRKRQRQLYDGAAPSSSSVGCGASEMKGKYGLVFARKCLRKGLEMAALPQEIKREPAIGDLEHVEIPKKRGVVKRELRISVSACNFAKKNYIMENSLCTSIGDPMVLLLLVESSSASGSLFFSRLLITTLRWMRRAAVTLWEFAAFLLSGSLASVFSQQGIHVLPLRWQKNDVVFSRTMLSCGLCKIYGARQSVPLLLLDFLALPFYFRSLHVSMLLGSLYLPRVLARYLMCSLTDPSVAVNCGENDSHALAEAGNLSTEPFVVPVVVRYEQNDNVDAHKSVQNAIILDGSGLNKLRRKRSSSRHHRSRNTILMSSCADPLLSLQLNQSGASGLLEAKASVLPELMVKPICIEVPDAYAEDSLSCKDESDASTPLSSHGKQRKSSKKSPVEHSKELRSALAEVKQDIDSVSCKANVLVTDADRCWREEGFEVSLDMLASKEWCIAVRSQGEVRYLHRPLDMRPCVVNRFTHAYMWAGEDRWKLEFWDRWDWLVFKEMHTECRERNLLEASSRAIPVPVFKKVSGYEDGSGGTFVQTNEYIRMEDDQVQRALLSKIARYDMDSGDEQCLNKYNSSIPHMQLGECSNISADNFEDIIFALEKDAYNNVDHVFEKEKALDSYQHLGEREVLGAIYDYWLKKRNKRRAALVREFQGPPSLRAQLAHKPFVRKKRSFKRQRSQTARAKPEPSSQVGVQAEALQRVQEAKNAAKRAVDFASNLRSRAQTLMANAELAVYKSVMALRIAESLESSETSDLDLSILD